MNPRAALVLALIFAGAVNSYRPAAGAISPTPTVPAVFIDAAKLPANDVAVAGGKVFIELRAVGTALGADVAFNAKKRQVTVTTLLHQSVLRLDDPQAGARVISGRVMVPLRLLAAALDVHVMYDRARKIVRVNTAGLLALPSGALPAPSAKANTIEGTVSRVNAQTEPAAVEIQSNQLSYTLTIPPGVAIQFRDTHGAIAGNGNITQVKPGDAIIATLDAAGHLLSVADIFAGTSGTIGAVAGASMVLTSGKVITADPSATLVQRNGQSATLADLRPGDVVTVRANPRTGKVREIVALAPGGLTGSTPLPSATATLPVKVDAVSVETSRALRAGQVLRVWANGTPGASASFDLSNVILGVGMRETNAGRYEGTYQVDVGTNLVDAPVFVRLRKGADTAVAAAPDPLTIITQPPKVQDTAPSPGARINTLRPSIYATFATLGGKGMDTSSLRVIVNNKDVSDQATRTAGFISYYPADDLPAGPTAVEVKGTDVAGNPLDYRWTFTIASI